MTDRPVKQPGPDHPITVEPNPLNVVVSMAGRIVADTHEALTLREAGYAPVQYIPVTDVDMSLLEATDHGSYCPYKGDCSYYTIRVGEETSVNAAWTYKAPFAAVAEIESRVAFYPDRVDEIAEKDPV